MGSKVVGDAAGENVAPCSDGVDVVGGSDGAKVGAVGDPVE